MDAVAYIQVEGQYGAGTGPCLATPSPDDVSVRDAAGKYLQYLEAVSRRSRATVQAYHWDLQRLLNYLGDRADMPLRQLNDVEVEEWIASMHHLKVATVKRSLNALGGLFRWGKRYGYVSSSPVDLIERPKAKRAIQPCPAKVEVASMLAACRGHAERAALLAMATSGLRRGELLSLTWENVDLHERHMKIMGKGDKERLVVVFDELLSELHVLRTAQGFPAAGPVFRGRQGKPLQISTLQRWFGSWLRRAHVNSGYTLHSLRRFAAKSWLDHGLNIRQVQLLLGHESLETTILYLNYSFEEIQGQLEHARIDFLTSA